MKKLLLYITYALFALLTQGVNANSFADNSVLASGKWVKIRVKESGICKLTYDELKRMGFSNPANIRVFGYGGSTLNEDLSFNKIDDLNEVPLYANSNYYLFYAQGPITWKPSSNSQTTRYNFDINPYSLHGYYFLTDNVGVQKRIETQSAVDTSSATIIDIYSYMDRWKHKKEEFNYSSSGKKWHGDRIDNEGSKSFSMAFSGIDTTKVASLYVMTAASSTYPCVVNVKGTIGDSSYTKMLQISLSAGHTKAHEKSALFSWVPKKDKFAANINFSGTNTSDFASVERIITTAYRPLSMKNDRTLFFREPDAYSPTKVNRFHISNCNNNVQIWDLHEPWNPTRIPSQIVNDTLTFNHISQWSADEYVAVDVINPSFISAEFVCNVANQNLHAEQPVDLVIITHPDLFEGAKRIAELHESYDGLSTFITTQEKIFNEFSSGTPDATAIRWFLKMLYEKNGKNPFYLLLLGDGCYDNRGILSSTGATINNKIITYQGGDPLDESSTYITDDYFCFLDNFEIDNGKVGNAKMDISVGRIPANSLEELNGVINKIETHLENKNYGKWKNRVCLLADDNEESSAYQKFCKYSDDLAEKVHLYNPAMEVKKIYLDAYTRVTGSNGSRYPDVEAAIKEELDKGVMIFNYIGHSSKIGFTAEHVFTQNQARSIFNKNCGFWFTASCQFSQFDDLDISGGENLLLNPNGGALALISSARVVFDNKNDNLNQAFFTHLFDRDSTGMPLRIGEVLRLAKIGLSNDSNKLAFNLLGDPALRIHYPSNRVLTDSIIEVNGSVTDTLNALAEIKVCGHIANSIDSSLIDDFNGTLYVTLFDKEATLYTKANIYTEEEDIIKNRHTYKDRPNILFSGQVDVKEGLFSVTIKVPKDINYSFGSGRFAYYAYDEQNEYEAQGAYEDFVIGGSCDNIPDDNVGPSTTLYMNTENFKSGDKVNSSPVFYAIVSDENGINASGCGIGHDITITLSDTNEPIILNNYFSYDKESYTQGRVAYQLNDLPNGTYTINFKVWDLLNNSSSQSITFKVDNELKPEVEKLIVYPNPAQESITLRLQHDQPKTVQTFRFLLYDINGILVYRSEEIESKNDGELSWTWDLRNEKGRRMNAGCYVGRVEIKTDEKKYTGKSKKIIILPE